MECRGFELRCKEIINITDGSRMGYVGDIMVDLEEGKVTAVTLTRDLTGKQAITSDDTFDKQLAALSFAAAVGDYNCVSWLNSGVLTAIEEGGFEDYTIQAGDVTITQTVVQEGYQDAGGWLFVDDSVPEDQLRYQMEFTLTLQA